MSSSLLFGGLVLAVASRMLDGPPWLTFGAAAAALLALYAIAAVAFFFLPG